MRELAQTLRTAPRLGAEKDDPEGSRYVILSDTLANRLADLLDPPDAPQIITKTFSVSPADFVVNQVAAAKDQMDRIVRDATPAGYVVGSRVSKPNGIGLDVIVTYHKTP